MNAFSFITKSRTKILSISIDKQVFVWQNETMKFQIIKVNRDTKPKDLVKQLNKILTGYYNYYGISFNFNWLVVYITTIEEMAK